eukprot:1328442-Amphidinium_carterae.1
MKIEYEVTHRSFTVEKLEKMIRNFVVMIKLRRNDVRVTKAVQPLQQLYPHSPDAQGPETCRFVMTQYTDFTPRGP